MSSPAEEKLGRLRLDDRVWGGEPRPPRGALCIAAGTLCVVGAKLPAAPANSFEEWPELLPYFPPTAEVEKAGSLAGALAANGVEIPAAFCCGATPGQPVS